MRPLVLEVGVNPSSPNRTHRSSQTRSGRRTLRVVMCLTQDRNHDKASKKRSKGQGVKKGLQQRRPHTKSFSSQKPVNDRQNRRTIRVRRTITVVALRGRVRRSLPRPAGLTAVCAQGGGEGSVNSRTNKSSSNRKENLVYRVDGYEPSDPTAIQNALNSLNNK